MSHWRDEFVLSGVLMSPYDRFCFYINNEELIIKYDYIRWSTLEQIMFYLIFNVIFAVFYSLTPFGIIFYCICVITMNFLLHYFFKKSLAQKNIVSTFNFLNKKLFMKKYELNIDFADIEKLVYCKNYCGVSENEFIQLFTLTCNKKSYLLAYSPLKEELIPENVLTKLKENFLVRELDYYTKIEVDMCR